MEQAEKTTTTKKKLMNEGQNKLFFSYITSLSEPSRRQPATASADSKTKNKRKIFNCLKAAVINRKK